MFIAPLLSFFTLLLIVGVLLFFAWRTDRRSNRESFIVGAMIVSFFALCFLFAVFFIAFPVEGVGPNY